MRRNAAHRALSTIAATGVLIIKSVTPRRRVVIVAAALAAGVAMASSPAHAAEPVEVTISDPAGTTVATVSADPNDPFVRMLPPDETVRQQWELVPFFGSTRYPHIRGIARDLCMAVTQDDPWHGSPVVLKPCNRDDLTQLWEKSTGSDGISELLNVESAMCLTRPADSAVDIRLRDAGCIADELLNFRINPL